MFLYIIINEEERRRTEKEKRNDVFHIKKKTPHKEQSNFLSVNNTCLEYSFEKTFLISPDYRINSFVDLIISCARIEPVRGLPILSFGGIKKIAGSYLISRNVKLRIHRLEQTLGRPFRTFLFD